MMKNVCLVCNVEAFNVYLKNGGLLKLVGSLLQKGALVQVLPISKPWTNMVMDKYLLVLAVSVSSCYARSVKTDLPNVQTARSNCYSMETNSFDSNYIGLYFVIYFISIIRPTLLQKL